MYRIGVTSETLVLLAAPPDSALTDVLGGPALLLQQMRLDPLFLPILPFAPSSVHLHWPSSMINTADCRESVFFCLCVHASPYTK